MATEKGVDTGGVPAFAAAAVGVLVRPPTAAALPCWDEPVFIGVDMAPTFTQKLPKAAIEMASEECCVCSAEARRYRRLLKTGCLRRWWAVI